MQFNENYPWYIQSSPVFTELYNGLYEVGSKMSCLDAWKIFYPTELNLAGLLAHAKLWGLATSWASLTDSLIYNDGKWAETYGEVGDEDKYWSGKESSVNEGWYRKYIALKMYIRSRPLTLETIKKAFEILLSDIPNYTIEVSEDLMACEVEVASDADTTMVLRGILSYDPTLLGKPVGIKITYTFDTI